jgi:hypothetical protein
MVEMVKMKAKVPFRGIEGMMEPGIEFEATEARARELEMPPTRAIRIEGKAGRGNDLPPDQAAATGPAGREPAIASPSLLVREQVREKPISKASPKLRGTISSRSMRST